METPQDEALFGRWLRRRRRVVDLTQKALARRVGCSAATIRKIEADERHPSRGLALALARALGVPEAERAAFVRFARHGWADRPPDAARASDVDRPWAVPERTTPAATPPPATTAAAQARTSRMPGEGDGPGQTSRAASGPTVVARDPELERLDAALAEALAGRGRVALVAGEAGQGKTTLLRAFAERAQAAHGELLVVSGACNAYTGTGDPFLPFREALQQLTGEVPAGPELEPLDATRADRLRGFAGEACRTLLRHGPQLVGTLLPAEPFLERAERAGLERPGHRSGTADSASFQGSPGAASQAALSAATTRVLTAIADERPLLLLLDDLQWLDRSSADLLLHLGRAAAGHRILLLGTYRSADVSAEQDGQRHVMQSVIHEIERAYGDAVIDLDRADGRAFLDAWLDTEPNGFDSDFREALWHLTGGQPLFTIELLRAMQERGDLARDADGRWNAAGTLRWDALPKRVAGALAERVERLEPFEQAVLRVASVEGEVFTAEAVARTLDREPREVTATLGTRFDRRHRLVAGVDVRRGTQGLLTRYRFRHNLIQRYVYDSIDDGERSYLHQGVADALEALLGDAADPVALAYHYVHAHAPERAAAHYRRAGDQARKAAALDQAAEHYRAALRYSAADDPAERVGLLRALGECQWLRGALAEARRSLGEALAGYRQAGDARSAGTVQLTISRTYYDEGDWNRSLAACREALALLEDGPETPELAWAQSNLSVLYTTALDREEGVVWARRALETAERLGAEHVRAHALGNVGMSLCDLGPSHAEEGLRMLSEAVELADRLDRHFDSARAAYNLGDALRHLGRYDEARARWVGLLGYARDHGLALFEVAGQYDLWRLAWRQGRWAPAIEQRAGQGAQAGGAVGLDPPGHPAVVPLLASADLDVGAVAGAQRSLERHASVLARLVEPQYRCPCLRARLRIAAASERPEAADGFALEIAGTLHGKRYVDSVLPAALSALTWLAWRQTDASRSAVQELQAGLAEAEARYLSPETKATAAEARGSLARARDDVYAAAEHLLAAAEHWRACGFPYDEARARAAAMRALAARGEQERADAARERAERLLSDLAAQLPTEELRASFTGVQRRLLSARAY